MIWAFLATVQFVARVIGYTILGVTLAALLYHFGALGAVLPLVASA